MQLTQQDIQGIADLIEKKVLEGQEVIRQEFYGAIQQLISNQQALADMVAMKQGSGEVVTALAHEFWQRSVMMEAQRVQAQLDDVWEGLKPQEEVEPEPEPEMPRQCPSCKSDDPDVAFKVRTTEGAYVCNDVWHNRWRDAL